MFHLEERRKNSRIYSLIPRRVQYFSVLGLLLFVTLKGFVSLHREFIVAYLDAVTIPTSEEVSHDDETTAQRDLEEVTTSTEVNATIVSAISSPTSSPTFSKVVHVEGIDRLYEYLVGSWTDHHPFCETIKELRTSEPTVPITFNITFSCKELYERSEAGTGNYLAFFYGLRRAAWSHENIELICHCHDAEETKYDLILPWAMGRVPARPPGVAAVDETEGAHCFYGPSFQDIRQDLRTMALHLVGLPKSQEHDHPLAAFAEKLWSRERDLDGLLSNHLPFIPQLPIPQSLEDLGTPPYSDVELDEVAVHFRCGDLMDSVNAAFSFMRFQGYVRNISPNATTIGILTQPYDDNPQQSRWPDSSTHLLNRCRIVVHALVDYIQERFPGANVSIRNEPTERITLSYLRMIMARQAVSAISSFGVMPAVATFGTGYIRTPDRPAEPYYWVLSPRIDDLTDGQVVLFKEPVMPVADMKAMWKQQGKSAVLSWFLGDDSLLHSEERPLDTHTVDSFPVDEPSNSDAESPSSPPPIPPISSKIITIEGIDRLDEYLAGSWTAHHPFCDTIKEFRTTEPTVSITFNISFSCQELYDRSDAGTGNFLAFFFQLRRAAWSHEDVELIYHCNDAEERKNELILPWIMGRFPARPPSTPAIEETEGAHCYYGSSHHDIRFFLRKMALGLYGLPSENDHPLNVFAEQLWSTEQPTYAWGVPQLPIPQRSDVAPYSDVDFDDAVLHFRCGDLMDSDNAAFSFMRFRGYVRHISPNATSIGILTQPLDDDPQQSRRADSHTHVRDRCRAVIYKLVDYIQERYPAARVTIRNNRTESITLSYLRMIMARQAVSGISSFGVMPTVATFGTGYIRTPERPAEPYYWVVSPRIDELTDGQVVLFEEPVIPVAEMKTMWEQQGESAVLAWFLNDQIDSR